MSAPTGVWAITALQRNVKDEQRHLLCCGLQKCQALSVTLDLKCSRKLKWKSHWKQGGNLCFSDTITRSLQMQQQQPRIDT